MQVRIHLFSNQSNFAVMISILSSKERKYEKSSSLHNCKYKSNSINK